MFSSDKNVETIGQLVEVLKHYIGLRSEYMKLDAADKVVRLLTALIIGSLLLALLALALIYLSFAAAFAMADYVGLAPAFCIVASLSPPAHTSACTGSTLMPYLLSSSCLASSSFFTLRPVITRFAPSFA